MPYISKTPAAPYYTVVFTYHAEMFRHLVDRASTYEGYLGIEAARNSDGTGVAAVYWVERAYGRPDS